MNPLNHQGQVEGGLIQGLGYALMEELVLEDGRISTLSFGDYKIPTSADVPVMETVLIQGGAGPAPYARASAKAATSPSPGPSPTQSSTQWEPASPTCQLLRKRCWRH